MISALLWLLLQSSGAFATDFHDIPHINLLAIQRAEAFLDEQDTDKAFAIWEELNSMRGRGLVYVDRVLQLISGGPSWVQEWERRSHLLYDIRPVLYGTDIRPSFHVGTLKRSIHSSAQLLLHQLRGAYRKEILHIYALLDLWDETDLDVLIPEFFANRAFAPYLIRYLPKGSEADQKKFAARVRRHKKYELIETALLFQMGRLRDEEMGFLFMRLLENAHYSQLFSQELFGFYGRHSAVVEQFKTKVLAALSEKIRMNDPIVLQHFYAARKNPAYQKKVYQDLLASLWRGSCRLELVAVNPQAQPTE